MDNDKYLKTIGEVSSELGLASSVLRFWESKFTGLKPQKRRGIRYYNKEDMILLIKIKYLLYSKKYTIVGALSVLKSREEEQKFAKEFAAYAASIGLGQLIPAVYTTESVSSIMPQQSPQPNRGTSTDEIVLNDTDIYIIENIINKLESVSGKMLAEISLIEKLHNEEEEMA